MNMRRLGEEVRSACRSVAGSPASEEASVHGHLSPSHRVALGEWLGAIRQPRGEFSSLAPRSRREGIASVDAPRGDLSRTHIMRLKGERAHLEDGLDRSRRFNR